MTNGFVYFFGIVDGGPVKIGMTRDVKGRFYGLQQVLPYKLEIIGAMASKRPRDEEREILNRLAASRLRGEWFEHTPAMLEVERYRSRFIQPASYGDTVDTYARSDRMIQAMVSVEAYERLVRLAELDHRSLSNYVEHLIYEHLGIEPSGYLGFVTSGRRSSRLGAMASGRRSRD